MKAFLKSSILTSIILLFSLNLLYSQKAVISAGPEIVVDDYNFASMNIIDQIPQVKVLSVSNKGVANLKISGISQIQNSSFSSPDLYSTPFPITIPVGQSIHFTILFKAKVVGVVSERITFTSDAGNNSDPYCDLSGAGKTNNISSNNVIWNRFRAKNPSLKNPSDDPLWIYNGSKDLVNITNTGEDSTAYKFGYIEEITTGSSNSFYIEDSSDLNPKTSIHKIEDYFYNFKGGINYLYPEKPTDSYLVYFRPETIGPHKIRIHFSSNVVDPNDQTKTIDAVVELSGVGTIPRIKVQDKIDFGTYFLGDTAFKILKPFTITNDNTDSVSGSYCDNLTIKSFEGHGNIGNSLSTPGAEGFAFDENGFKAKFPNPNFLSLAPGKTISIDAEFYPSKPGNHSATLEVISDADLSKTPNNNFSIWTGEAILNDDVETDRIAKCSGLSVFPNIIKNKANINFKIVKPAYSTLRIVNIMGEVVGVIYNGELEAGNHNNFIIPDNLMNGIYYLELISGFEHEIQKFVVMR